MDGFSFSSTTSCKTGVRYTEVEKEILVFLSRTVYAPHIQPFLWDIPDYIGQDIRIEKYFETVPYKGIKIHPFAHSWDFTNTSHLETLHSLFDYAARGGLPVLIHTGYSGVDDAGRFERFFCEYPRAKCILAHCRPLEATLEMLEKHKNVYCDTAFVPEDAVREIVSRGFGERILCGSDFPITHYFRTKYQKPEENPPLSLREHYAEDAARMREYRKIIDAGRNG
jgi:predicted TIM-barrel fold metal-dependent hydrolase